MGAPAQLAANVALGKLTLRVRAPGGAVQTVVLTSACCRIGSGDSCTLRLRAPGIRDVHCIISRGPRRTVVRGLTKETWLNGAVFFESPLEVGDCLRLGRLEIDVLTDERSGGDADTACTNGASIAPNADEDSHERTISEACSTAAARQLQQLTADQTAELGAIAAETPLPESEPIRSRVKAKDESQPGFGQPESTLQAASGAADSLEGMGDLEVRLGKRLGRLEDQSRQLEQALHQVSDLGTVCDAENRQWRADHQQAEAARRESLGNLDRRVNDLSDAMDGLRRQAQTLDEEFRSLKSEQIAAQQELQRRVAVLETDLAAARSRESAREASRATVGAEGCAEPDRRDTAQGPDRSQHEAAAAQSSAVADGQGDLAFEQVAGDAPQSTLDVLRRMGTSVDFSDDEEAPVAPAQRRGRLRLLRRPSIPSPPRLRDTASVTVNRRMAKRSSSTCRSCWAGCGRPRSGRVLPMPALRRQEHRPNRHRRPGRRRSHPPSTSPPPPGSLCREGRPPSCRQISRRCAPWPTTRPARPSTRIAVAARCGPREESCCWRPWLWRCPSGCCGFRPGAAAQPCGVPSRR